MKTNTGTTWMNYVGELCLPKRRQGESDEDYAKRSNEKKYIKVTRDFALAEKAVIRLQPYKEYLDGKLAVGKISEQDYDLAKNKQFIKYVLHIPPQKVDVDVDYPTEDLFRAVEIRRGASNNFYLIAKTPFTIKKGSYIWLRKISEAIQRKFEQGLISEADKEHQLNGIRVKDENGNPTSDFWLIYVGDVRIDNES